MHIAKSRTLLVATAILTVAGVAETTEAGGLGRFVKSAKSTGGRGSRTNKSTGSRFSTRYNSSKRRISKSYKSAVQRFSSSGKSVRSGARYLGHRIYRRMDSIRARSHSSRNHNRQQPGQLQILDGKTKQNSKYKPIPFYTPGPSYNGSTNPNHRRKYTRQQVRNRIRKSISRSRLFRR